MKALILLILFTANLICKDNTSVYICDSTGAKKYHISSRCRGLNNCQSKILKTTLQVAKNKKRTLCGWEK
jgi:hypothetical protein